ncbi:MAG: hypothetical protein ACYDCN_15725 [Bacteroidia bacterium]
MKKLSGIFHIALNLHRLTIGEEITFGTGLTLGSDPQVDMTKLPYSQTEMQRRANVLQTLLGNRVTDSHPTLTKQEQKALSDLSFAIIEDAREIVRQANEVAAGNRQLFETIITRIGLHPSKLFAKHVRIFEVRPNGKGGAHVIFPAEEGFKNIIRTIQVGETTAEGILATTWLFDKVPIPAAEVFLNGLQSGKWICIRYAVWVVPPHKKPGTTTTGGANTQRLAQNIGNTPHKMLTILPTDKHGKIVLTQGVDYYHFSDAIYIIAP